MVTVPTTGTSLFLGYFAAVLQHVPKTNGEIPSVDDAFSDHQRLLNRLVLYGLVELKVNRDGNCQAAADSYGVKIFILTSFRDTCNIEILPVVKKSNIVICLSFWAEVHYNQSLK